MLTFIHLTGIRNRYQLSVLIVYRIFCQIIFQCFSRFDHLFCRIEFSSTRNFDNQTVFYGRVFAQVTFSELIPPDRFQNYLFVRLVNIEIAAMRSGYEGEIEITAVVVFFNSLICVNGKDNSSIPISRGSGEMKSGLLRAVLHHTDVVVQPRQSNTWGALSLDHVYEFMGGMNLAVRNVTGKDPEAYFADYRNRNRVRMQDLKEAIGVESRSTIFNPEYIKEVMKGGASSASQITEVVTNTYGWNVTKPEVIDDAMWNQIYDVYVTDSYKLGTEDFFKQQNPAALQEITAVMLETARKGMWEASEQQISTLANLHTDLVKEFGSAGSGFAGGNAKLQDYIASRVQPERATVYKEQIQSMKTAQVATDKKGMVLKKDEVAQAERGEKNALNGVWIAGGVFALFVILLLVLKKKRKGN